MNAPIIIIGAIMMIMGFDWYRRSPVSAGRPASLLMLLGALGIIASLLSGCPAHADNNPFSGARSISVKMVRKGQAAEKRTLQQKRVIPSKSQHRFHLRCTLDGKPMAEWRERAGRYRIKLAGAWSNVPADAAAVGWWGEVRKSPLSSRSPISSSPPRQ